MTLTPTPPPPAPTVATRPTPLAVSGGAPLDIGRCFGDANRAFGENFATFFAAGILFWLLSLLTLLIFAGPMSAGLCAMSLAALSRPDGRTELRTLFTGSARFGPFVGLFFLTTVAELVGLAFLIVPGLLLITLWLYPYHFMVDRGAGVFEALRASAGVVRRRGFGGHFMFTVILFLLNVVPSLVPYVGFVLDWIVMPYSWLLVTSAYIQQVREQPDDLRDLLPQGFPVRFNPPAG